MNACKLFQYCIRRILNLPPKNINNTCKIEHFLEISIVKLKVCEILVIIFQLIMRGKKDFSRNLHTLFAFVMFTYGKNEKFNYKTLRQ